MKKIIGMIGIIILISANVYAECEDSVGNKSLSTHYKYGNKWGGSIPIEAVVCWNGVRVAKAVAVKIDKTCGTPYCMELLETHWDGSGKVITYKGELLIQLGSFGSIQKSEVKQGEKKMQLFTSWP